MIVEVYQDSSQKVKYNQTLKLDTGTNVLVEIYQDSSQKGQYN